MRTLAKQVIIEDYIKNDKWFKKEKRGIIFTLYFAEDLPLNEIAGKVRMPASKVEYIKDEALKKIKGRVKRDPDLRRKMGVAMGFITQDDPMASKFQGEVADAVLFHGTLPGPDRLRELWSEIDDDYEK